MPLFPLFLKLRGRPCLVVGAGKISEGKIAGLLEAGAHVRVIALNATERIVHWHKTKKLRLKQRTFRPRDLDGMFLVVAATNSPKVHRAIYRAARARKVLCNIVDVPPLCDFYYPAVVKRGNLQIAISTSGQSPALAKKIRQELERQYGPGYEQWVAELGETRRTILASSLDSERKRSLLLSLASREAFEAAIAALTPTDQRSQAA